IQGSASSFGWVGYSFYEHNADVLKAFEVDGGHGCVAPTPETIADGTYPLSRPLFIYVNKARAAENPAVAGFVDFHLGDGIGKVTEAGYVALTADDLAATKEAWEAG
ncbi:MAG: PstS family phosphate ABC transporter substrate-binding protein, partial [Actinomycetota bacterium]